jgi:type IV pilus assembly protein PilC
LAGSDEVDPSGSGLPVDDVLYGAVVANSGDASSGRDAFAVGSRSVTRRFGKHGNFESIGQAIGEVREGKTLSDSLERSGHFPSLSIEMMRVGEQTGSLPDMLNHVADFYDEDVNIKATALLSYVEPAILIFVAGFVAYILISLYLPIFSLGSQIKS